MCFRAIFYVVDVEKSEVFSLHVVPPELKTRRERQKAPSSKCSDVSGEILYVFYNNIVQPKENKQKQDMLHMINSSQRIATDGILILKIRSQKMKLETMSNVYGVDRGTTFSVVIQQPALTPSAALALKGTWEKKRC